MKIGIINLKSGNLLSIKSAIQVIGYEAQIIDQPNGNFDALIMPGQGRFATIAANLDTNNWREFIADWVKSGKIFIGICVGMQILFESSQEDPNAQGLGLLEGKISKLEHPKTPMVGWAQLDSTQEIMNQQFAYFVNSFAIKDSQYSTSTVNYGFSFCASVQKGNLYGFQFHPEKSGQFGQELLQSCFK